MTFDFCAPPLLIADDAALIAAAAQWQECAAVALDTEFRRTNTFFPRLALIQLGDGPHTWLIDTQVAAALTGYGFSRGYSSLVRDLSGVELSKQETRSDWLQRPLSNAQLDYAALDVHYLLPMYEQLMKNLRETGRLRWMDEEMVTLAATAAAPQQARKYYQRIKGAWRLDRRGIGVLQQLAAWREGEARLRNRPRNWIVADKALLEIAAARPKTYGGLAALAVVGQKVLDRYGGHLIDLVATVLEQPEDGLPETLPKSLPREFGALLDSCRQQVQAVAAELGLAAEILARKVDVEQLVRSHQVGAAKLPPPLDTGWRREVIGEQLLSCVQGSAE